MKVNARASERASAHESKVVVGSKVDEGRLAWISDTVLLRADLSRPDLALDRNDGFDGR